MTHAAKLHWNAAKQLRVIETKIVPPCRRKKTTQFFGPIIIIIIMIMMMIIIILLLLNTVQHDGSTSAGNLHECNSCY